MYKFRKTTCSLPATTIFVIAIIFHFIVTFNQQSIELSKKWRGKEKKGMKNEFMASIPRALTRRHLPWACNAGSSLIFHLVALQKSIAVTVSDNRGYCTPYGRLVYISIAISL